MSAELSPLSPLSSDAAQPAPAPIPVADLEAIQIVQIPFGKGTDRFANVARKIYAGCKEYVVPLDMDLGDRFNPKKNPFFEHAEGTTFIATKDGQDVGRITAQIDLEHQKKYGDKLGFFGFLDTIDDAAVAKKLLDAAAAWLKEKGMVAMRGPMSLCINEEIGCLVEGFDTPPSIMMPHHYAYQGGLIERAGLVKEKDVFAWSYTVGDVPARAKKAHDEITKLPEVKIRSVDMSKMQSEVHMLMEIFNETWSDNWGAVPATESELKKMADDFKLILIPDLALVAEIDGKPAAISIALPNLNEIIADLDGKLFPTGLVKLLYRLKVKGPKSARLILLGIRKKYRTQKKYMPMSTALYVEMNERGRRLGIEGGELGWTLEDNAPVNLGIRAMGGKLYKRYRVYRRDL